MESKPIVLPIITVQHDILSVFSDVDSGLPPEDVWVSVYKDGEPSVHGKVRVFLDEVDRSLLRLESHNGIKFNKTNRVSDCP
jgi:proteasomal ATPase-associated factor 1